MTMRPWGRTKAHRGPVAIFSGPGIGGPISADRAEGTMPGCRVAGSTKLITHYARWSCPQALALLALTGAAIGWCVLVSTSRDLIPFVPPGAKTDLVLYRRVVDRVRAGEGYYDAAGHELKAMGYPTRSIFNWRTPLYAWVHGKLPDPLWGKAILIVLAVITFLMAGDLVIREGNMGLAVFNGCLMVGALLWCIGPDNNLVTEVWAGTLIAMSACAYARGWWRVGVTAGLLALFFRELALPYCAISLALALWRGHRREVLAWTFGLAMYGLFMINHGMEVTSRITSDSLAHKQSWIQFGGAAFLLATARMNFILMGLPSWCTAIYLPLALVGLAGWRGPMGTRLGLATGIYVAAFTIVGMPVNFYWGLMYTPLLTFGFARSVISLRDLVSAVFRPAGVASQLVTIASAGAV